MYKWQLDLNQSIIEFRLSFCRIGLLWVKFVRFDDHITAGSFCENPLIKLGLEVASLTTDNEYMDKKLKSPAFLSVAEHPFIFFYAENGCQLKSGRIQELSGIMCIKEICRPLTLIVTSSAVRKDPPFPHARFTLSANFDLKDFGFPVDEEVYGRLVKLQADVKLTRIDHPKFTDH